MLIMKKFISYFLQGLLYITPIGVTIYILWWGVKFFSGIFRNFAAEYDPYLKWIALIVIVLIVAFIGFLGPKIIKWPVVTKMQGLMNTTPIVRLIYSSVKDLLNAFVGKNKKFGSPVRVQLYDSQGVERIGFITQNDLSTLGMSDRVAVYFPYSYGIMGEVLIVESSRVRPIEAESADVMKFIVTGGVTTVEKRATDEKQQQ